INRSDMAVSFQIGDVFNSFEEFEAKLKQYQQENFVVFVKEFCSKVKSLDLTHKNHPVDEKTAAVYPENRRPVITETVKAMAGAKITRKNLRHFISESQGICMLPQDVYNMSRRMNVCDKSDSEGVEELLRVIRDQGGHTKFGMNESGEFEFVLFVTAEMKNDLLRFPDILVMDVTYKVNKYLYPLVNVMCVDAEGGGRPVLHGFIRSESCVSVIACLDFLKSIMSDALCAPSVFFLDKDLSEIAAVRETFPEALVRLCSFHTATAVKRALQKQNLSSQQAAEILTYFKEQRDTRSQEKYEDILNSIRQNAPDETVRYFETNWWSKADIWAAHTRLHLQTLHVTTTNHVESYHSKIKQTLSLHTRLTDCMKTLLDHDADLVRTKDIKTHLHNISHSYNVKHADPQLEKIINSLTSFSGKLVTEQYNLAMTVKYTHTPLASSSDNSFQITGETLTRNTYTLSPSSCDCEFFSNFNLPCRHVFSLRNFLKQPLYSYDLLSNSRFLKTEQVHTDNTPSTPHATDIVSSRRSARTQEGRYRIVSAVTSRLNAVFHVMGENCFNHRMEQLEQFLELVTEDKNFCILEVTGSDNQTDIETLTQPSTSTSNACVSAETVTLLDNPVSETVTVVEIDMSENEFLTQSDQTGFSRTSRSEHSVQTLTNNDRTGLNTTENCPDLTQTNIDMTGRGMTETMTFTCPDLTQTQTDIDMTETLTVSVTDQTETRTAAPPDDCDRPGFSGVKLPKVKVRGRPRKAQAFTRQHKKKVQMTKKGVNSTDTSRDDQQKWTAIDMTDHSTAAVDKDCTVTLSTVSASVSVSPIHDESVCDSCGLNELDKDACMEGKLVWVQCTRCERKYHRQCLSPDMRVANYVCYFCLPGVVREMKSVLDDCFHNSSL
ncbi:zinc finger SWIM domain-containing protein 3, partial [Elysia marginata]